MVEVQEFKMGDTVFPKRELDAWVSSLRPAVQRMGRLVLSRSRPDPTPMTVIETIEQTCHGGTQRMYHCVYWDGQKRRQSCMMGPVELVSVADIEAEWSNIINEAEKKEKELEGQREDRPASKKPRIP